MGQAKNDLMEAEERGWFSIGKVVCSNCVEDTFLKSLIAQNASAHSCDYCSIKSNNQFVAASCDALMEAVAPAAFGMFNDPGQAGVPYDGGYLATPVGSSEMLLALPFEGHDDLFDDVAESFVNTEWVRAAGGHWAGAHDHELYADAWSRFVYAVRHRTRYFFNSVEEEDEYAGPGDLSTTAVLTALNELTNELSLVQLFPKDQIYFRARVTPEDPTWLPGAATMGPPPEGVTPAGRMNPAGIPYLYLAIEEATAIAELVHQPPVSVTSARFRATRDLQLVDLTSLRQLPSIFDLSKQREREGLLFLREFSKDISKPVSKDGREHISYVPTQVVSEYFAKVHDAKVDGLVYPSAVRPSGKNIVLFPTERGYETKFEQVEYVEASSFPLTNWSDVLAAIR